jgi:hypothetical protein
MPPAAPAAVLSDPPALLPCCAELCWGLMCAEVGPGVKLAMLEPHVLYSASEECACNSGKLVRCPVCMTTTGGTLTGSCMSEKGLPAAKGLWFGSWKKAGRYTAVAGCSWLREGCMGSSVSPCRG